MAEPPISSLSSCTSRSYTDNTNELNCPISQLRYFGAREVICFGLSAEQIGEVQKRLAGLSPGVISSVKRIRENSRLLREQGITQSDLAELFEYLSQTGAVEWLASDQREFRYLGGL